MSRNAAGSADPLNQLRRAEAYWLAVLETARDAIIAIDRRGRVTLFNRTAEEIFRVRAGEVLGRNVSCLMPSPYREEHDGYIEHYEQTGEARAIGRIREVFGRRWDGEEFPIELSVSRADVEGERLYVAIIRDVSERRRSDEAVHRSEARFDAFMRNSPATAFMKDEAGRYVYVNPTFEDTVGRPAARLLGRTDYELWPPEIAAPLRANDRAVAAAGQPIEFLEVLPTPSGDMTRWLTFKFPLEDPSGARVLGGMGVDLTPRLRAEERLRETERVSQERQRLADIGAVTAKIVHDLGNPIGGLSMQAQLILRRATRDPAAPLEIVQDTAHKLAGEVRRLEAMLRELAAASRERRLELEPVDLVALLDQTVALWQPVAEERGVVIVLNTPRSLDPVEADAPKIRRVLDNLVKNAMEAIGVEGGMITLALTVPTPQRVRVSVVDTGPGVPEGVELFRLFETTKPEGSGLGLAVSRQIVHAHGGELIWSRVEPHGARFDLELPRVRAAGLP